jgi:branched-chain amino acid transport system ATP-binding protein
MLYLNSIEVKYSHVILVLKGVSLEVPDGAVIALMGGNGGGKSTTLKAISGLLSGESGKITSGSILWDSVNITNKPPEEIAAIGIIQVQEGRKIFEHLTAEENLIAGGDLSPNMSEIKKLMSVVYNYFPRLKDIRHRISGYLSGGEQQMLVVGRAMMANPRLLMLDEPSLGLSPLLTQEIFNIIKRLNKELKTTILLVEQNVRLALDIAEYGYVMENGKVVLNGPSEKLIKNEDIKQFYMGLGKSGQRRSYRNVKHYKRRKRWLG